MKFKIEADTIYDIEIVEDGLRSAFANASLAWGLNPEDYYSIDDYVSDIMTMDEICDSDFIVIDVGAALPLSYCERFYPEQVYMAIRSNIYDFIINRILLVFYHK